MSKHKRGVKGSKEAKEYMASIRAKRGGKSKGKATRKTPKNPKFVDSI